ncbi:putative superoxide dismutase [Helianthus annuus]|nr:putative superoxide dismutase [Helianthus annuus]
MQEAGGEPPHGLLGWAIDQHFGSMEKLVAKMNGEGAAVQLWMGVACSG